MVLTGARELIGWERNPHSVHIPLRRQAIEGPLGLPAAAGDRTSHGVFIFCGFAQASADSIFIESGPKTAGIRTCLATQREISVLWGRKAALSCPLQVSSPLPRFHHVVPSLNVFQNSFVLRESCFSKESG